MKEDTPIDYKELIALIILNKYVRESFSVEEAIYGECIYLHTMDDFDA